MHALKSLNKIIFKLNKQFVKNKNEICIKLNNWKIYFFTFCFVLLAGHFCLIISYLKKPNSYSVFYTDPYFHQNWSLFVPPPECNYNLYVYNKYDNTSNTDIFRLILSKHQINRFSGNEALLMALSNSIHYFEKEAEEHNFKGGKVIGNEKFMIIEKFVSNYLKNTDSLNIENAKIILCVSSIKTQKLRVYFN